MSGEPLLPFTILGETVPASPLVLSVPHGGRTYPAAMHAALRVPPAKLVHLEDRHIDTLALAARQDEPTLIARHGRAWIDLNRGEDERDPLLDLGSPLSRRGGLESVKVRSGLGLVPRRAAPIGDIWARRLEGAEVDARIASDHRPWHGAIAAALARAKARFGVAILVDLHSMPPLGPGGARVVIGDRFGRSAGARLGSRLEAVARGADIAAAANTPYPGGHTLDRHGKPQAGIHALQIEIDRSLYLDEALDRPGPGLAPTARLLRTMLTALVDEALPFQQAAE